MEYFNLPDLGEGLQEAEIIEWHVNLGDKINVDQLLVSVETAKAIVDIPSPHQGEIAKCFGKPGDVLQVGQPLVAFRQDSANTSTSVVGKIQESEQKTVQPDHFIIGAAGTGKAVQQPKALPAVRALAKRLGVDLKQVKPSRADGMITSAEVKQANQQDRWHGQAVPLRGSQRTMAKNMMQSAAEVAQVTLFDDADIHCWPTKTDISVRLIRAIGVACQAVPQLNANYDGHNYTLYLQDKIDLGIAVDTAQGLFVPVLRDIGNRSTTSLRQGLDTIRQSVTDRSIPPQEMLGATIMLSNFGTIAGRYASPVVVPPSVAILGAGVIYQQVVAIAEQLANHRFLPLSLSFDHRPITGGDAGRFLQALKTDLEQAN